MELSELVNSLTIVLLVVSKVQTQPINGGDPCHPSVPRTTPELQGVIIIGKRSVDDLGTPHGKVANCTTTVPLQTTDTKTSPVAIETAQTKGSDSYTETLSSEAVSLSSAKTANHVTDLLTSNVTSTEEHLPPSTDNQSSTLGSKTTVNSSRTTSEPRTTANSSRTTTSGPRITANSSRKTTSGPRTTANSSRTTTSGPRTTANSSRTTTSEPRTTSPTTSAATPMSTTSVVGGASKDTSDGFDHELAIIFGSMLGLMLLALFCFGVFRCYRREQREFNKTQNNLPSLNL